MVDQAVQITHLVQLFTSFFPPSQYDTINQLDEVAIYTNIRAHSSPTFQSILLVHHPSQIQILISRINVVQDDPVDDSLCCIQDGVYKGQNGRQQLHVVQVFDYGEVCCGDVFQIRLYTPP